MRMLVKMLLNDCITDEDAVRRVRMSFGERWAQLTRSEKVEASGMFADARGGFVVISADSVEDLWRTLGPGMLDSVRTEMHPIMESGRLVEMFSELTRR